MISHSNLCVAAGGSVHITGELWRDNKRDEEEMRAEESEEERPAAAISTSLASNVEKILR